MKEKVKGAKEAPNDSVKNQLQGTKKDGNIDLNDLENDLNKHLNCNHGILRTATANKWLKEASLKETPKRIFGDLMFDNELCFLFGDTNTGKSILAIQIADAVSSKTAIPPLDIESKNNKVLYLDCELSDKQFETRYSAKGESHYSFSDNFLRSEIDADKFNSGDKIPFEKQIIRSIEATIRTHKIFLLIIDNLTYLSRENEKSKDALPLMKELKGLKTKYNLSILILGHTPKRDMTKPLSKNDLHGSKMLINFCDSAFAIGESTQASDLRYLKQIKARNTSINYDKDNVLVFCIDKPYNFLCFEFQGFSSEYEHLKTFTQKDKDELNHKIIELKKEKPHLQQNQIAMQLGTNKMKVSRVLKKYHNNSSSNTSNNGNN